MTFTLVQTTYKSYDYQQHLIKLGYNMIPLVPGLTDAVVALLPAPDKMLLLMDDAKHEAAYLERLYGPKGPQYHPLFASSGKSSDAEQDSSSDVAFETED
jgi:hypothetical protein